MKKKICIITPDYITSSPRTVKEADALWQAGFEVRVVFSQGNLDYVRSFDRVTLKEKPWKTDIVGWSSKEKGESLLYWKSKFRYYLAKKMFFLGSPGIASHAQSRVYKELLAKAALDRADLYIGHYPAGLSAAFCASRRWQAHCAYDAEDLHSGEGPFDREGFRRRRAIRLIENNYMPACSYISCVSELVADEMVKRYPICRPVVIHNVFPLAQRSKIDGKTLDRKGPRLSLYWYSQVIGEDRGIQDAIRAAGYLKDRARIQIHLRGYLSEAVKRNLSRLAKECRIIDDLYFHFPVPPEELLSRTAEHDLGMALEQSIDLNRIITVSNKLFFYLLAGLALLVSDVSGQKYIFSTCPEAGFMYPSGDYRTLAGYIKRFLEEPQLLSSCKQASIRYACQKWNWEIESCKLIEAVEGVFSMGDTRR